jgi:hypothetical protein
MEGRREKSQPRDLGVRVRERRTRREPPEDDPLGTAVAQHVVGPALERNPVPEVERELKAVRHDADDGVHGLAEPQLASDDVVRAGEAPLPDVVADDEDGRGAGRGVGVDDDPAHQRRHSRYTEAGGRDLGDRHELDRSVGRDRVAPDRLKSAHVIDRLQAVAPPLDVLPRRVAPLARLAVPDLDGDDPVPLVERKPAPQDDVERSEHDRRDPDCHGHRQPAGQREPPVADQQAEPQPHIEPRRGEPGQAALCAERFERLNVAAGGGAREPRRVVRRVPLAAELVFGDGEVSGKLALQVVVGPAAAERAPRPPRPLSKRGKHTRGRHAGSSKSVCMTATI